MIASLYISLSSFCHLFFHLGLLFLKYIIIIIIFIPLHRSPERERERQEMAPANPWKISLKKLYWQ